MEIIGIVRATYEGAKNHVLFEVQSGVRQGCILSPLLFLILLGDVLRKALKRQQAFTLSGLCGRCLPFRT